MKRLPLPLIHEPQAHEELLKSQRQRQSHHNILPALAERFRQYEVSRPELRRLAPTPDVLQEHSKALYGLYDSRAKQCKEHLLIVRRNSILRCPYCGVPSPPTTLDHFIPRGEYPEFSMYIPNLIPCCFCCNNQKGEKLWNESGNRLFVNPYSDDFLDIPFVLVHIVPDSNYGYRVPLFEFEFDTDVLSAAEAETCESHFGLLVSRQITTYFSGELGALKRAFTPSHAQPGVSREEMVSQLTRYELARRCEYGPNCWESLLYRAVLGDDDVLHYIMGLPSPSISLPD